jgi:ABC-type lipoprotein export system ATPase subunit
MPSRSATLVFAVDFIDDNTIQKNPLRCRDEEFMLLKRVEIENYRSCVRTSFDVQPGLSVLIGPNGSGKTNVLQAIMLLNKIAELDTFGRHSNRDAIAVTSRIKALFEDGAFQLRLNASVTANTTEDNRDVLLGSVEKWFVRPAKGKNVSFEFPLGFLQKHIPSVGLQHYYEMYRNYVGRSSAKSAGIPERFIPSIQRIAKYCLQMRYYGASQFTNPAACPASIEIEQAENSRRLFRHRGHARILYDMYLAKGKTNNQNYAQFMDMIGPKGLKLIDELTFHPVRTSSTDYTVRVGGKLEKRKRDKLLVIPQFRIGKQKLSPNQLSEGTFKTLALLFHVIMEDSSALLIEEPEVCVHHGLLASILEIIKDSSRRRQIIISTHSDYVLDHVQPENVYRIAFDKKHGTIIRHIRKIMTAAEMSALRKYLQSEGNLGEYWREGGLGSDS